MRFEMGSTAFARFGPASGRSPRRPDVRNLNSMRFRGRLSRRSLLLLAALPTLAAQKRKPPPGAVIFGTVFQESGLALPGTRVVAYNEAAAGKKYKAVTNYRGEYRIHVPAGEATYVVSGSARKFEKKQRTVKVYDMEQATVNLILKPKK